MKLLFQDEARFGRLSDPVRCWAPPRVRPCVPKQFVREYLYGYTAVCPQEGEHFSLLLPHADTETMSLFLQMVSEAYADYRLVMVMDNAGWHTSAQLEIPENIRLIHQPAHSPEVNPVEPLWEDLREKYFRNRSWDSLDALVEELVRILGILSHEKETVRSLTGFPWVLFDI